MNLKKTLYRIIFEADTPAGKWFDIGLIISIVISVLIVMLDSVQSIRYIHGRLLNSMEWLVTILFTIEFILRLYCSPKPIRYIFSFFGVVDILSVLPTYIGLFLPGTHYLTVIRILRVLRIFRILKLVQYMEESKLLIQSIRESARKIVLFICVVMTISTILGSIMYLIEGEANGFTSIPKSIYWAIVTLTTVGYGDISPMTDLGQAISTFIMILGYSIIVVPTGFVSAGLIQAKHYHVCDECGKKLSARSDIKSK